jgi:hypothetical protein
LKIRIAEFIQVQAEKSICPGGALRVRADPALAPFLASALDWRETSRHVFGQDVSLFLIT